MNRWVLIGLTVLFGCAGSINDDQIGDLENEQTYTYDEDFFVGERIDGPANIRDKPNGEVVFELFDGAIVQVADLDEGELWYRMAVWAKIPSYNGETIPAGAEMFNHKGEKIGTVKSETYSILDDDNAFYLEGYTYKNNIQPESLIERALETHILKYGRGEKQMRDFTKKFGLDDTAQHQKFSGPFIYENFITDPSPGYRLMLLFESDTLQGFYHSRKIELDNIATYKLWRWNDRVSFFNDYPKEKQLSFVEYMEEWLQGVD